MTLPGPVSRGQVGHSLRRQHKDYSKVSLPLVVAQALTELPGNLWNEEEENRRNSPSKKPISPKLRQEKEVWYDDVYIGLSRMVRHIAIDTGRPIRKVTLGMRQKQCQECIA